MMATNAPLSPGVTTDPRDGWIVSPDGKKRCVNTSGGRERMEKYLRTVTQDPASPSPPITLAPKTLSFGPSHTKKLKSPNAARDTAAANQKSRTAAADTAAAAATAARTVNEALDQLEDSIDNQPPPNQQSNTPTHVNSNSTNQTKTSTNNKQTRTRTTHLQTPTTTTSINTIHLHPNNPSNKLQAHRNFQTADIRCSQPAPETDHTRTTCHS